MLTVIGAEAGSIVALNWAMLDWSWPQTFAYKQGQDVKALVLLSPLQSHQRLNATTALGSPAVSRGLSLMIAVGKEDRGAYSESKRIYSRLERIRPPVPRDPDERRRKQDLFLVEGETTLQGTKLTGRNLPINRNIVGFIELRLVQNREDLPWKERKSPLSGN
jgi:hypothetical protein